MFTSSSDVEPSIVSQASGLVTVQGNLAVASGIKSNGEIVSSGPGAGFRVLGGTGDNVNGAPWYGVGAGTLNLFPGNQNAVQVGGYYGLDFENATGTMVIRGDNGNVGIETDSPEAKFEVNGDVKIGSGPGAWFTGANLDPAAFTQMGRLGNSMVLMQGANLSAGGGEQDFVSNRGGGDTGGFRFYDYTNSGQTNPLVTMTGQGDVGIGTTTPGIVAHSHGQAGPVLEIAGSVVIRGSLLFGYGSGQPQSEAFVGSTCAVGGDYAEAVDILGNRASYEPGEVLVLSSEEGYDVTKSSVPYSRLVAGIYSTRPGYIGRRQLSDSKNATSEVPMAMVGVVPAKASAENGSIHRGDLLVTSSLPGYVMKGTDTTRMLGAVVGKAMGNLDRGTGFIEVLVSLQ